MKEKIVIQVELYYNDEESLKRGVCEVVTKTMRNPQGTWKECKLVNIEVEVGS